MAQWPTRPPETTAVSGHSTEDQTYTVSGLCSMNSSPDLRPISGHTVAETLLSQSNLDTKLVPPSLIRKEIPPELDDFVMRMIRYSPSERQQSSLELIEVVNNLTILNEEDGNVLATATRHKAKNRNLASLELSDTHYWESHGAL